MSKHRFNFGKFFTEKTIISQTLPDFLPNERKQQILSERDEIMTKVKSYINEHLNPAKKFFYHHHPFKYFKFLNYYKK